MSKKTIIVRLMAEVPGEPAAASLGNGLLATLSRFGILWLKPPMRYWKVPEWFEVAVMLTPKDDVGAEDVLDALGEGWQKGGDEDSSWAVWNSGRDATFFDPQVRWANVETCLPGDSEPVRVNITGLKDGWLTLNVATPLNAVHISISYTPNDFVRDLVTAVSLAAKGGDAVAIANTEPTEVEFRFVPLHASDRVRLRISKYSRSESDGRLFLSVDGSSQEVLVPFAEELRSLERDTGVEKYRQEMRREFPSGDLQSLLELLGPI